MTVWQILLFIYLFSLVPYLSTSARLPNTHRVPMQGLYTKDRNSQVKEGSLYCCYCQEIHLPSSPTKGFQKISLFPPATSNHTKSHLAFSKGLCFSQMLTDTTLLPWDQKKNSASTNCLTEQEQTQKQIECNSPWQLETFTLSFLIDKSYCKKDNGLLQHPCKITLLI